MKTVPQAVIFDLGKVLVDFDYGIAARAIASQSSLNHEAIHKFIDQSPLLFRFETGLMTKHEFFDAVRSETKFKGSLEEFGRVFGDIFQPIEPMVELHSALQKKGVPTYIFSNTNELAIKHIIKSFPFFNRFDGYIYSYEHGAMKPHARLYEVVEQATSRQGAQLLYIDDRTENIEAGAARGWQVILQETPEKTLAAVRKSGILD